MTRVLLPGSYDPVTLGHVDIIRRAAAAFDFVTAAIFVNSMKKPMFDARTRLEMLRASIADIKNAEAVTAEGLTADYVRVNGYTAIIKGLRSSSDYDYERMIAAVNRKLCGAETYFLPASGEYDYISSTSVREMIRYGMDLSEWMPAPAIPLVGDYTGSPDKN